MRLIYLFHSGFLIEAEDFSIIFDYYRGGENIIDKALRRRQPMYVLVSHEHRDHYNPEILTWKNLNNDIHYIFPCEMSSLDELSGLPNIVYLDRGESYEDDRLRVNAFGSTDMGVSYLVTAEGETIFHAGDLNNWHWRDESTEEEVWEAETAYLSELDYMKRTIKSIDVAMFPVDARLGKDYMRGAEQFVGEFNVGMFVPMHFYLAVRKAESFAPIAKRYGTEFVLLSRTGDSVII